MSSSAAMQVIEPSGEDGTDAIAVNSGVPY